MREARRRLESRFFVSYRSNPGRSAVIRTIGLDRVTFLIQCSTAASRRRSCDRKPSATACMLRALENKTESRTNPGYRLVQNKMPLLQQPNCQRSPETVFHGGKLSPLLPPRATLVAGSCEPLNGQRRNLLAWRSHWLRRANSASIHSFQITATPKLRSLPFEPQADRKRPIISI